LLAETVSAAVLGVEGVPVRVQVDVAFGLPGLTIVGLAGSAVQEARERVRSALRNSGFELPARRITVNLAPADLPKDGTGYDLAIAVGILAASGQLTITPAEPTALIGELALDGTLSGVAGTMALVAAAAQAELPAVLVPEPNAAEAAAVPGPRVHAARTLGDAVAHLGGVRRLPTAPQPTLPAWEPAVDVPDLAAVVGQPLACRALEVAVAGRHSLALTGPPGIGKTLVLRCAAGLQPPLEDGEAIEVSRIYSVAGLSDRRRPLLRRRPFRAPHHTISTQALVGGGPRVRPGEASLAHRGVLFLDEALQFRSDALEALREPLEAGEVTIARVDGVLALPARFLLLTAFNPCPCGWLGSRRRSCRCDEAAARRYRARLSGPLRDRIDLYVPMDEPRTLRRAQVGDRSRDVAARIAAAWARQRDRQGCANGELRDARLGDDLGLVAPVLAQLRARGRSLGLSPRRVHRAARIARTLADLDQSDVIGPQHVDEALRYRPEAAA
jgi:magnesium chelatase family protein